MFNDARSVSLSEFSNHFNEVIRDCEFRSVGKIPTRSADRLVPISNPKFVAELLDHGSDIAGVVITTECLDLISDNLGCAIAENPIAAVNAIHADLCEREFYWSDFETRIDPSAMIHERAYVAEKNVVIGANTVVQANATILERVVLGKNCFVGAGSVIGTQAYEVGHLNGAQCVLPQAGGVKVENDVTFLSNVVVARSMFPIFTQIGGRTSFDNGVHVAHDCVIGERVKMMAASVLCGRVTVEDDCSIAPNATISNGITLGSNSYITLGAVVVRDVEPNEKVTGNFAIPHKKFIRNLANSA